MTGHMLYDVDILLKGLNPSEANPNRTLLGSSAKDGAKLHAHPCELLYANACLWPYDVKHIDASNEFWFNMWKPKHLTCEDNFKAYQFEPFPLNFATLHKLNVLKYGIKIDCITLGTPLEALLLGPRYTLRAPSLNTVKGAANLEPDPRGLLGSFENSYIPENPRTPPISYISQTVIPFKKPTSEPSKTGFETKQKTVHICTKKKVCTYAKFLEKKKSFFRKFVFATGLIFERFLAPRSRFFEKVNGLGVLGRWIR
ncbi:hypothetical protein LXL04_002200 [Taraxacum kok-saghyz]